MKINKIVARLALIALIAASIGLFFLAGGENYLSLGQLQERQDDFRDLKASHPLLLALEFGAIYVAITGLTLPGAALMTLAAGAIFGLVEGTIIASIASTLGATLAFLASRFLLRDFVQKKFSSRLYAVNQGMKKDGPFYLLTLRLVPAFPFFLVNLLTALTPISTLTFFWVSQIGMLPGTIVYVNAGTQLAKLHSLSGVVSPSVLGAFILLGLFPLVARRIERGIKANRIYSKWPKPKRFERNVVVIGAGSAGLVSAYIASAVKAKVTLIEKHLMGGDCLNYGCVPSKALIRSSRILAQAKRAEEFGLSIPKAHADFAKVMERVQRCVAAVAPHDSVKRYTELGVDVRAGTARITSPWTVEVDGEVITTRSIIIAAGAEPFVPPIPGLSEAGYLTSENLWVLRTLPRRLLVLGGGSIGCELSQAFARLGSEVTQVEVADRLLLREDPDVSSFVRERLENDGVKVHTAHAATSVECNNGQKLLHCTSGDSHVSLEFDEILVAIGRRPRISGYGLEEMGITGGGSGTFQTNEYLETLYPNIYACGDVAGPYQLTHVAAHQAWYAAVHALFGQLRRFRVDYSAIPAVTFVDPEVARVGLNESEAEKQGVKYELTRYGIDDLDRAIVDGDQHGWVKVLTVPGSDRILGATIVGESAGELLVEFTLAIRNRIGLNKILGTIHAYPTLAEANKYAAGVWKKAHAPQNVLRWLERYHNWRLG
ncbi:FAD-dependent oxidoreductase [Nevskia soli]|uniref:FAD-dependent oxidoreductase n=1 Tax=Nevskia soli TaxID=418856 RepID=UPI0004A7141A|nr:bifunctional TVP38/TMEM64 family protein/FAD-dependent oxidoreductase [Nevskia soli]